MDKKKKTKDYCLQGSYTVEASFLMPLLILFMVFIIYFGFYLHDVCVVTAILNRQEETISYEMKSKSRLSKERVKQYEKECVEQAKNWLLLGKNVTAQINLKGRKAKIELIAEETYPVRLFVAIPGMKSIQKERTIFFHNPEYAVRIGYAIYEEVSGLKVYEKLQDIVKGFESKLEGD